MSKSKLSLGCLFWIALILLVIVIILANLKTANEIIRKTGFDKFVENLFSNKGSGGDVTDKEPEASPVPVAIIAATGEPSPAGESGEKIATPVPRTEEPKLTPTPTPAASVPESTKPPVDRDKPNVRNAKIYFIKPDGDGVASVVGVSRSVRFKDEPLRETIAALLAGPSGTEEDSGYITTIPRNAKLLDVYVKNDIAYLDFNEAFRFNSSGKEGQRAAIIQIVYTCTEFSNVSSVLFLINGEKVDYLGPEGIFIGEPVTRTASSRL